MMKRREGIRRLSLALGLIAAGGWYVAVLYFIVFSGDVPSGIEWGEITLIAVGSGFLVWILVRLIGWVWEGFIDPNSN